MNKFTKTTLALVMLLGMTAPLAAEGFWNDVSNFLKVNIGTKKDKKNKISLKKHLTTRNLFYAFGAKTVLLDWGLGNVAVAAVKSLCTDPYSVVGNTMSAGFYGMLVYRAYQEGWFSKARDFVLGDDSDEDEEDKPDSVDSDDSDEDESDSVEDASDFETEEE